MIKTFIHQLLKLFYPLVKKLMPYEVYAYLAAGAVNTLLNIGLFVLLYHVWSNLPLALEAATAVSFIITVFTGFWMQKNFAFTNAANTKQDNQKQLGKYALVALQGQVSAYLLTKFMMLVLHFTGSTAYILTAIIMLTLNYFLQKYFTFRSRTVRMN